MSQIQRRRSLGQVRQAGYKYVSTLSWGAGFTLPAPLNQPFRYDEDGYPELWELPCHGWHENVVKYNTQLQQPIRIAWPIRMPEAIPPDFLRTPQEHICAGFEEPIAILAGMVHIDTVGVVLNDGNFEPFFAESRN